MGNVLSSLASYRVASRKKKPSWYNLHIYRCLIQQIVLQRRYEPTYEISKFGKFDLFAHKLHSALFQIQLISQAILAVVCLMIYRYQKKEFDPFSHGVLTPTYTVVILSNFLHHCEILHIDLMSTSKFTPRI